MPTVNRAQLKEVYPEWFSTPQPKVADETMVRVLSKHYLKNYGYRLYDVDFSVIPEMIRVCEETFFLRGFFRLEVMGHLLDAHNENLPHYVRVQHFDLAGARYWEGTGRGQHTRPQFMALFRQAGGV